MTAVQRSGLDAASSILAVQDEVAVGFKAADATVRVHRTGYFNHTYAPDLVLSWRGERDERAVYLRTTDSERYLAEDIDLARGDSPIFVPLAGVAAAGSTDTSADESLTVRARRSRALVAETASISALADAEGSPIRKLVARAVIQGGSGVVPREAAAQLGSTVASGFEGALTGDPQTTSEAIRESSEILDDRRTGQLAELLQAAWIGGGQIGASFPGIGRTSSSIQPEALKLLLDTVAVEDMRFWERLAQGLQLSHFAGVSIPTSHAGFQMLMKAAAPRLKGKAARVIDLDAERVRTPRWAVNSGRLALAFNEARVEFATQRLEDFEGEGVDVAPAVRTFARRARGADLSIMKVTLVSEDRRLDLISEDGTSVTGDDRLEAFEADLGAGTTVLRASLRAEGKDLSMSMSSATAAGVTRSTFYLSTLAEVLLPLTLDLDERGRGELVDVFSYENGRSSDVATSSTPGSGA